MHLLLAALATNAFLLGAAHEGSADGASVAWKTTLAARSVEIEPPDSLHVELARPLTHAITTPPGVTQIRDSGGSVTALEVPRAAWTGGEYAVTRFLHIETSHPYALSDAVVLLEPPLLAGGAVQRVRLDGPAGLRFTPDAELGIEQHVGFSASRTVVESQRDRVAELFGHAAGSIYLLPEPVLVSRGLTGTLRSGRPGAGVSLAVAGAFAGTVVLLAAGYRFLARRVDEDSNDALLREELRRMREAATRPDA